MQYWENLENSGIILEESNSRSNSIEQKWRERENLDDVFKG